MTITSDTFRKCKAFLRFYLPYHYYVIFFHYTVNTIIILLLIVHKIFGFSEDIHKVVTFISVSPCRKANRKTAQPQRSDKNTVKSRG